MNNHRETTDPGLISSPAYASMVQSNIMVIMFLAQLHSEKISSDSLTMMLVFFVMMVMMMLRTLLMMSNIDKKELIVSKIVQESLLTDDCDEQE